MTINRDHVRQTAIALVAQRFPHVPAHRACLYLSLATCVLLDGHGVRAVPQAGSASWPMAPADAPDDGVSATHYSYVYTPGSQPYGNDTPDLMNLPEVHCWAAVPETQEIIDFTTCHLPQLCEEGGVGDQWANGTPDPYIWEDARKLRDRRILYAPHPEACEMVLALIHNLINTANEEATR